MAIGSNPLSSTSHSAPWRSDILVEDPPDPPLPQPIRGRIQRIVLSR